MQSQAFSTRFCNRLTPGSFGCLFRNSLPPCRGEFGSPRLTTLGRAQLAHGQSSGILASVRIFERRTVHLLANRLFNHAAGDCEEVARFFGSFWHDAKTNRK